MLRLQGISSHLLSRSLCNSPSALGTVQCAESMSVNQRKGPSCFHAAEAVAREEGKQKTDGSVQGVTAAQLGELFGKEI